MMYKYLHKNQIYTFNSPLNDVFYTISLNKEDQDYAYVLINDEEQVQPEIVQELRDEFFINGISTWFNKYERSALRNIAQVQQSRGNENMDLIIGDTIINIPIYELFSILDAVEIYSYECLLAENTELKDFPEKLQFYIN